LYVGVESIKVLKKTFYLSLKEYEYVSNLDLFQARPTTIKRRIKHHNYFEE